MQTCNLESDAIFGATPVKLILRDDPHSVDYAGDVAEDRQQDVDPKLLADAHLQEYP